MARLVKGALTGAVSVFWAQESGSELAVTALGLNSLRSNLRHPQITYTLWALRVLSLLSHRLIHRKYVTQEVFSPMVEAPQLQEAWEGQDTLDPKVQFCIIPNPHEKILTSPSGS